MAVEHNTPSDDYGNHAATSSAVCWNLELCRIGPCDFNAIAAKRTRAVDFYLIIIVIRLGW